MAEISVVKVCTHRDLRHFLRFPYALYKDCSQFVPDLESDIKDWLDPRENPALEFTEIQPFIAYRDGILVGRVVGIVNRKANECWQTRKVRFSHIEFVDDEEVSAALIDAVSEWGWSMGMDTIEGPMGITDFDKEGMLVEDFDLTSTMNTIYNPEYYPRHMEAMGFEKEVDWVQIRIQVPKEVPARYSRTAQYAREQIGLRVIKIKSEDVKRRGIVEKVFILLNLAYKSLFGFSELSPKQVDKLANKYLNILDMQLIPVVMNEKDEVVGVAVTMGSMSRALQKAGGRLWPRGWWYILRALRGKGVDNAEMLLVAVHPEYQGMGVNALFFDDLIPIYNQYGFEWAETAPQLEFNVKELSQWKPLNPQFVKRRRCYHKLIDKK